MKRNDFVKQLLICDLDNTLYDWVEYFVPAFYAMIDEAVEILKCNKNELLRDLQKVHQLHHDTEHPFALLETNIVMTAFPNFTPKERARALDSAFHAFNSIRKSHLTLFDGVLETLDELSSQGVKIVAHTEGKLYSVLGRLEKLGILEKFSAIYCSKRSSSILISDDEHSEWFAKFSNVRITELPIEDRKPNARVLIDICRSEGYSVSQALFVGDSLGKDIYMAKQAGVFSAWAKYGNRIDSSHYRALVAVSHWTRQDVERESELKAVSDGISPDAILESSFKEIIPLMRI